MQKRAFFAIVTFLFVLSSYGFTQETGANPKKAKNVILMISDGLGFNQHIAGAYWRFGGLGEMSYEKFPLRCACTTFASKGTDIPYHYEGYDPQKAWDKPEIALQHAELTSTTDSAAAMTALQTGKKTRSARLGMDVEKQPLELVAELAQKAGKSTGAVSTIYPSHATPGGVFSHTAARDSYDEIFRQMTAENGLTVVLGAGHPLYDSKGAPLPEEKRDFKKVGGIETWEEIVSEQGRNGYTFIDTLRDFEKLAQTKDKSELPQKVIGIARITGGIPPIDGGPSVCPPVEEVIEKVLDGYQTREMPTLSTMSLAALNVLSQNPNGFYVMIEGSFIDGACHRNNTEQLVMEQTGFTKAIDTVVNWVEENSSWDETVLIVTADHETGFLWGPGSFINKNDNARYNAETDEFVAYKPIVNNGCGELPGVQFIGGSHTNLLVPVWGIGVGIQELEQCFYGEDKKAGEVWGFSGKYLDNTDIGLFLKSKM